MQGTASETPQRFTRSQDKQNGEGQNSTSHQQTKQNHSGDHPEQKSLASVMKQALGSSPTKQFLGLALVSFASSIALFKGFKALSHSSLIPSSIFPSFSTSIQQQMSDQTPAWLAKIMPFIDQTTTPQIVHTPKSFNVIYQLPGFTSDDLSISTDDDHIYVDGRVTGDAILRSVGVTSGSKFAQQDGITERTIHAQTSIPRSIVSKKGTHEINAYLKNGILRISICLDSTESIGGIQKRVVKLFSDVGHSFTHPSEMFGRGKSTDYLKDKLNEGQRSAEETYEQGKDKAGAVAEEGKRRVIENAQGVSDTAEDARDTAQDYIQTSREKANEYAQYGREKMDEYIGKPVRDARDAAGNLMSRGKEYVEESIPNSDTIANMERRLSEMKERAKKTMMGESDETLKQVPVKKL